MALKQFRLPDIGEGLTEGDIVQWLVSVGDTVTVNQNIVEVETAKVTVELPSPFAGLVTELLHDAGATVDVGAPIITIDTEPGAAGAAGSSGGPPGADGQLAPGGMPPSEQTLAEVEVAGPEAPVEPGVAGGPAPAAGQRDQLEGMSEGILVGYGPRATQARRRPRRGAEPAPAPPAAPAQPAPPTAPAQPAPPTAPAQPAAAVEPAQHAATAEPAAADPPAPGPGRARAKPPVRKYAKSQGIDLATLAGSGPDGAVTRADVDAHLAAPAGAPDTHGDYRDNRQGGEAVDPATREQRIPIKGVRKVTAAAMVSSAFTAPHVTEWITLDVSRMMSLRDRVAARRDFRDVKVSPMLFVARALLAAAEKYPMINSAWDEARQEIVVKGYLNLGIAAATPRGLLVPNIKDAGALSTLELARSLAELTTTAREGRCTQADLAGGTITISNVGVFGVDTGTPILNPGEAAILALGTISRRPWVHKGRIKPRYVTTLGLSFDHRIVDGELGSRFLAELAGLLADPALALAR